MVRRVNRLSQFVSDQLPSAGTKVQLLCEDHVGTYVLPFLCRWTESCGWTIAKTQEPLKAEVLGWREPQSGLAGARSLRSQR